MVVAAVAGAGVASPANAVPAGPECADVQLQVPFNTSGTATFACSGTGLTYEVDLADHGRVGEASGNAVAYSPNGGYFGSDTFEVFAIDAQNRTDSFLVHVTVDPPLAVTPDPNDQLTGQDADGFWDLDAGETDTFTLSCAPGKVAVDGSALVQTSSIRARACRPTCRCSRRGAPIAAPTSSVSSTRPPVARRGTSRSRA